MRMGGLVLRTNVDLNVCVMARVGVRHKGCRS